MLYSALFLLISTVVVQWVGSWIQPDFYILANRGIGKVLFTLLVIGHLLGLALSCSRNFLYQALERSFFFLWRSSWISAYAKMFVLFFTLHSFLLLIIGQLGYVQYNVSVIPSIKIVMSICLGFVVTFFLAWTEELIFRGVLYAYIAQFCAPLVSVVITSLIFMFAHDLTAPWMLISHHWQLGLGLFLLGCLLNLLLLVSGTLYVGMGAHAGLVSVKVLLRRLPLITYLPDDQLPWWLHNDLRQTVITHLLFLLVIVILVVVYKKKEGA